MLLSKVLTRISWSLLVVLLLQVLMKSLFPKSVNATLVSRRILLSTVQGFYTNQRQKQEQKKALLIVYSSHKFYLQEICFCFCLPNFNDDKLIIFNSGRASSSPILDLFITFLSVGSKEYLSKVKQRKEHFKLLKIGLTEIAEKFHLKVLETPGNSISIGNFPFFNSLLLKFINRKQS